MAEKEYISREAANEACREAVRRCPSSFYNGIEAARDAICHLPAADVRPAIWTDEPIIGTWFMTHNQGQSGFEIHFRTDDKAKYEAVQDECRRQIDHAKPAADVRPVVRGMWIDHQEGRWIYAKCSECGTVHDV